MVKGTMMKREREMRERQEEAREEREERGEERERRESERKASKAAQGKATPILVSPFSFLSSLSLSFK